MLFFFIPKTFRRTWLSSWHSGLTYGYTAFMGYFPKLDAIYIKLSNFAENYFIDEKEKQVIRQQHPNLDESPESEKFIHDALEKRYPWSLLQNCKHTNHIKTGSF